MLSHHTKDKGDMGVGFVIASLMSHGLKVALPLSEHLPFDLIAISNEGKLSKVQVKYAKAKKGGDSVLADLRSSWADKNGNHQSLFDQTGCDVVAVYCPDSGQCYYLGSSECSSTSITLQFTGKKGRQAEDFIDPTRVM